MTRWPAILWAFTLLLTSAEGLGDRFTAAGIAEFTAAYQAWDGERFGAAAGLFRQATTNAPSSSTNFYWLGVAHFHRRLQVNSLPASRTNRIAAEASLAAALAALRTSVQLNEELAESHALLATIYGMKINGNFLRAARFGPRVMKHSKLALRFGEDNPRVQYLLGTCQFHTAKKPPAQRKTLATLLVAEKLFQTEALHSSGPLEPRWGHSSCLTFIGRTYELLGQRTEAEDYFRKALAQHPADYLARDGLARVIAKD